MELQVERWPVIRNDTRRLAGSTSVRTSWASVSINLPDGNTTGGTELNAVRGLLWDSVRFRRHLLLVPLRLRPSDPGRLLGGVYHCELPAPGWVAVVRQTAPNVAPVLPTKSDLPQPGSLPPATRSPLPVRDELRTCRRAYLTAQRPLPTRRGPHRREDHDTGTHRRCWGATFFGTCVNKSTTATTPQLIA